MTIYTALIFFQKHRNYFSLMLFVLLIFISQSAFTQNYSDTVSNYNRRPDLKNQKILTNPKKTAGSGISWWGKITTASGQTFPGVSLHLTAPAAGSGPTPQPYCNQTYDQTTTSYYPANVSGLFIYNYTFSNIYSCNNRYYTVVPSRQYYTFSPAARQSVYPDGYIITDYDFVASKFPYPDLIYPGNGSTGLPQSLTLQWSKVAGAKSYRIQVDTTATFNSASLVNVTQDSTAGAANQQYSLSGLIVGKKYFWRLQSIIQIWSSPALYDTSDWTPTYNFRTLLAPPTLATPLNNYLGSALNPTLYWNIVNGADTYRLQVSTDPAFGSFIYNGTSTTSSQLIGTLSYNSTYYWRVCARSNQGDSSAWSSSWNFKTKLAPPTLSSPGDAVYAIDINPTPLIWNSVIGASNYRVQIATDNGFSSILKDSVVSGVVTKNYWDLLNGTTYFWRVRAFSALVTNGDSSDWSGLRSFVTKMAIPVLSSPTNGSYTSRNPLLAWSASIGKISYNVQYVKEGNTDTITTYGVPTEAFGLAGLEVGTKYYWRVKAKNAGDSTAWTGQWSFTVTGFIPALIAPVNGRKITTLDTTLVWLPVPNATQYAIDYSFLSNFSSPVTTTQVAQNGNSGNQSLFVNLDESDPTLYYKTIYWRVRAFVNSEWTENSSEWSYVTNIYKPNLLFPNNAAINISTRPTFSWQIVAGAETYKLQVSANSGDWSSPIINQNVSASTYTSTTILPPGTYYWRVQPFNSSGQIGAYSDIWSFVATKWRISGGVVIQGNGPLANLKIYLNDGVSNIDSVLTAVDGSYSFYANGESNYNIKPETTQGYTFIPAQRTINNLSSDYPGQDFTASLNLYKIRGTISTTSGGLDGVTIVLSNGNTALTSGGGKYEFLVTAFGDYTVTPQRTGYNFKVSGAIDSLIYHILGDSTLNFDASLQKFKISGFVYDAGSPLNGATVVLSGSTISTVTTGADGKYEFQNLDALGSYSVAPSTVTGAGSGKTFVPPTSAFNNLLKDETQDFISGLALKKVSGQLRTYNGIGVNSIPVSIHSGSFTTSAISSLSGGVDGIYSAFVPSNNTYIIEPLVSPDPGYNYYSTDVPHDRTRTITITDDVTNMDFIVDTSVYKISGYVTFNNTTLQNGVAVRLDTATGYRTIATYNNGISDGYYEFFVRGLQSVSVRVASSIYNYLPTFQGWDYLIGNKNQNFNAMGNDVKNYTISGIITKSDGSPIEGVSVKINRGDTTLLTNSSGFFSVSVSAGGSYSITPLLEGYTFLPAPPVILANITTDRSRNFTGYPKVSTVSGKVYDYNGITKLSGVTVNCDNGTNIIKIVTDTSGSFSFNVRADSNYTITPVKTGFVFNPNNRSYSNPSESLTDQNFKAELNAYSVIGYVFLNGTANGVKNAIITITGNPNVTTTTDAAGKYTFTALGGESYIVQAQLEGFIVTSSAGNPQNTGVISSDKTLVDFYALAKQHIISGTIFEPDNFTPLSGVTVECPGAVQKAPFIGITNSDGTYAFTVNESGVYSVTPNKAGVLLNPGSRVYINPLTDYSNQNYKAELNGYLVDGYAKKNGVGLSDVVISYTSSSGNGLTITDSTGYYKFTAGSGAIYSVQAYRAGFNLTSSAGNPQSTGTVNTNVRLVDFVAVSDKYTISGKVILGASGLSGVSINCPGASNAPTITDASGNYSLTVDAFSDYTITAVLAGFTFTPSSHAISNVSTNITGKNFIAVMSQVPILVSPANGTLGASTSPILVWDPVAGATSYTIQYSTDYMFGSATTLTSNSTTVQVNNLPGQTTYFWRVNATGSGGTTDWSTVWLFRTSGGHIEVVPAAITYEATLIARTKTSVITVSNKGVSPLRISNVTISGPDASSFSCNVPTPINLAGGASYTFTVDFIPQRTGVVRAAVLIDHNDAGTDVNPIQVPLMGTGVLTMATLELPKIIDFGNVAYRSGSKEKTIIIGNNSPIPGDILLLNSNYFESVSEIFQVMEKFPISLEPGSTYPITVRFNPEALGSQQNTLHLLNSSANLPDGAILVTGNVIQGELIVAPSSIDFGNTSNGMPYKDSVIMIQNNSSQNITITAKWLSDDTSSFTIDNSRVITLRPNQSDYIIVRFFPHNAGRKNARFNITSDYYLTPALYVPLTGIAGEEALLKPDMLTIDFGILRKGEFKDTTLTIKNEGCLDLNISSMFLSGLNTEIFSLIGQTQPLVIRGSESKIITIRATAILPIGPKSGQLKINSNDPTHPETLVNLLATVKSNVLFKSVDNIEFDTVDVGYYQDSLILLRNQGDLSAVISQIYIDGPFSSEFSVVNNPVKSELFPNDSLLLLLRFSPSAEGLRYARLVLHVNDPSDPIQVIILKGWGRKPQPRIGSSGGHSDDDIIDFGAVPILETKSRDLIITNYSLFGKLRIDSMYYDPIEKQPFYYSNVKIPVFVKSNSGLTITLNFNPHDKVNSYTGYLNIVYRDSTEDSSKKQIFRVKMKGSVIFPGANIRLTPILKFGKVVKGLSKIASFEFSNLGVSYLRIDSMSVYGADSAEFKILQDTYPIIILTNEIASSSASFTPQKIGSKEASIKIFWNDLFVDGNIEIWAEGVLTGSEVLSVKSSEIPKEFALKQNYPNPFNPSTKIEYALPQRDFVSIKIYNSIGQEVAVLVNEEQSPGVYIAEWFPKYASGGVASGIYFYRIQTSKFCALKKMILLK
jgi:hypothetical protein